jgi:hypothetical protein
MTMYDDDVDEGVASKGVPCRDRDRGRAAAPAIAPAGVEIVLLTEWTAALEGVSPTGVPVGRFSLTDLYLRQTGTGSAQPRVPPSRRVTAAYCRCCCLVPCFANRCTQHSLSNSSNKNIFGDTWHCFCVINLSVSGLIFDSLRFAYVPPGT